MEAHQPARNLLPSVCRDRRHRAGRNARSHPRCPSDCFPSLADPQNVCALLLPVPLKSFCTCPLDTPSQERCATSAAHYPNPRESCVIPVGGCTSPGWVRVVSCPSWTACARSIERWASASGHPPYTGRTCSCGIPAACLGGPARPASMHLEHLVDVGELGVPSCLGSTRLPLRTGRESAFEVTCCRL